MIKGLEKLKLTADQRKLLDTSELQYRRFARIYFEILDVTDTKVIVKVWQMENQTGEYLCANELTSRAKDVFEAVVHDGIVVHVRPIPFNPDDIRKMDLEVINQQLVKLGLQAKDLVKLLDIDKSSISLILSGQRELTKWHKAAFYYLFKDISLKTEKKQVP